MCTQWKIFFGLKERYQKKSDKTTNAGPWNKYSCSSYHMAHMFTFSWCYFDSVLFLLFCKLEEKKRAEYKVKIKEYSNILN